MRDATWTSGQDYHRSIEKIEAPLCFTIDSVDMEPAPAVAHGNPVTVDEGSLRLLEGIFALSDASGSLARMLQLKITEAPDVYGEDFWSVKDIEDESRREWLIFDIGEDYPSRDWPVESALMVLRNDLDVFISNLDEQPPIQLTEGEELRALEALGLLSVTFAEGRRQYTHERSGKPNCAQVAEAMSQQARQGGEVYGMSKSKLQRLLSDALAAWEEKRG